MTSLVHHQDAQAIAQGFKDGAIGTGVKAIGVGKDDINGSIGGTKLISRGLTAPLRYGDDAGAQKVVVRRRHDQDLPEISYSKVGA